MRWVGLFLIILITGCVPIEKQCQADSDCVKKTCCHAADAVNKDYAPDCKEVICTMECVPETIDCGQGEIKCLKDGCQVILNS